MSELKYNPGQSVEGVSLDDVTSSPEERAKVEANVNTPKEDAMEKAVIKQRNVDQIAHWNKQAQKGIEGRKKIAMDKLSKAYLGKLMGESVSDNIGELKIISDKINAVLLNEFSVEDRRLYAKKSRDQFRFDNSFGEGDELDEMEDKIFEALKNDKEIQHALNALTTSEEVYDLFVKKALRAERSSVYKNYLQNL